MLKKLTKRKNHNSSSFLMSLQKMGARYPSRLSFSRSLLRTMIKENWVIKRVKFDLNSKGYGIAVYEVYTPKDIYSLICFSQYIDDNIRSDRVIANTWDTSFVLHIGKITNKDIIIK